MDLRKVRVYVISPGVGKYKTRLKTTLDRLIGVGFQDIEHIKSIPDDNLANSLSRTNLFIFEKEKDGTGPFIIIEDDIQIEDIITENMWFVDVPPDASALYLGVSMWVYPYGYHTLSCGENIRPTSGGDTISYNDRLVRISGMTSTHAIMFIDRTFIKNISVCIRSHLQLKTPHDLVLATLQKYYHVYAMKQPFFYQDIHQGGQEKETRLIWKNGFSFVSHHQN